MPDNILSTYYANSYYGNRENKFHPWLEYLIRTGIRNRAKYLLHFLNDSVENNFRVLDIGCGRGTLPNELAKKTAIATDLNGMIFLYLFTIMALATTLVIFLTSDFQWIALI